jgi:hypothetical protein
MRVFLHENLQAFARKGKWHVRTFACGGKQGFSWGEQELKDCCRGLTNDGCRPVCHILY